jgi:RNase H-fold protein (predicted Holliday junction resolvase)
MASKIKFVKYRDLIGIVNPPNRFMGIDIGTKFFGVAISDENNINAIPLQTLIKNPRIAVELSNIAHTNMVSAIVVGVPVTYEGGIRRTMYLLNQLWEHPGLAVLPVVLQDESSSTQEVMEDFGDSYKSYIRNSTLKNKTIIDKLSAGVILQRGLDKFNNLIRKQTKLKKK